MAVLEKEKAKTRTQVLIVEDEGLIAADIQSTLRGLGYHVSGIAASAGEALELAGLFASQLVLMDIKIRGPVDGIDLARELRQRYGTPIVFLTSNTDPATFARAERTTPFGFVTKPYTEFHLKAAIELALSRAETEKASQRKEASLSAVLASLLDAIIATDTDGNVLFMNRAAEVLTGWNAIDAIHQQADDVLSLDGECASELLSDAYCGDLLNVPVIVKSRLKTSQQRWLSASTLMNGQRKSGTVLLLRGSALSDGADDPAGALRATEDMLSTLCLLRLEDATLKHNAPLGGLEASY